MADLRNGVYYTHYNDNGDYATDGITYDEVPCVVDMDTLEVVEFGEPVQLRDNDVEGVFVETESIVVDDEEYDALKTDEWEDAKFCGYEDDIDRTRTILFDNDKLCEACGW